MTASTLPRSARYARWDGVGRPITLLETHIGPPAAGQVLVEVELATVCGSDVHTVTGKRASPVPSVLGHEQVGRVVAVGTGVPPCVDGTPVEPGLRVVWAIMASCGTCEHCTRGMPQKCLALVKYGHELWDEKTPLNGGFATHCVLLPGTAVAAVPEWLPASVAAPASCATATVAAVVDALGYPWRSSAAAAPTAARKPQALITGAGMLGLTAVAMLAQQGLEVLAVDPDPKRREQALQFGAARAEPVVPEGYAADVAADLSGAPAAVEACLDALAVGGTAVLAGSVSPRGRVQVDPEQLVRRLNRVVGVHNYRPEHLLQAVRFLTATEPGLPFAELVTGDHTLADLEAALAAAAQRGTAARQAVRP